MNIDLLTKQDLLDLEERLLKRLKDNKPPPKRWLRSKEVCEMLGLSASGLQNMRVQSLIPFSKVGGSIFYPMDGIEKGLNLNLLEFPEGITCCKEYG